MTRSFALTYDYRCPWGRIVHDHVYWGLKGGTDSMWNEVDSGRPLATIKAEHTGYGRQTINRILDDIDWPVLNEFKHTTVAL